MSHQDDRPMVRPCPPRVANRMRRRGTRGRALVLAVTVSAAMAALLGVVTDPASAAYSSRVEGGTLRVTGDGASDRLTLIVGGVPAEVLLDVGEDGTIDATFDRTAFTAIAVQAGGGADTVHVLQLSSAGALEEAITVDGGNGNDAITGAFGDETLLGGSGNDTIDGNQGVDRAVLGAGTDTFVWDPGDGSDVVEGGTEADSLVFNGSNIAELLDVSADAGRVRLFRDVGTIAMSLDDVEHVALTPRGGADVVTVSDMSGTDLRTMDVDLAGSDGAGDVQPDAVVAVGTNGADRITFGAAGGTQLVRGLRAEVRVAGAEAVDDVRALALGGGDVFVMPVGVAGTGTFDADGGTELDAVEYVGTTAADAMAVVANGAEVRVDAAGTASLDTLAVERLNLRGNGGADAMSATGNVAALTSITMDGGSGDDVLRGGNGADTILGGSGNDAADGNQGNDVALLGAGNDTFTWDPGDGSDTVEGQGETDALAFNGSNIGELLDVTANAGRVRLTRDIAGIVMDLDDVERTTLRVLGGADVATVGDLRGTDLRTVDVDLAASSAGDDGTPDAVVATGTAGPDRIAFTAAAGGVQAVRGLVTQVQVRNASATDVLRATTLGGDDVATLSVGTPGTGTLELDGGEGSDVVEHLGTTGDDAIAVTANGTRARVSATGTAELDVMAERIALRGLGGADRITAAGNLAALTALTMDGGDGADTLLGGNGADTLIGAGGNDAVDGNQGADTALLGPGNDTFQWDPGDASDTVEGQDGTDALTVNGANIGETFGVVRNGGARVRVVRDVASVTLDLGGVERTTVAVRGGADSVYVGDLTGTEMRLVTADLGVSGAGDGSPDIVGVQGTEASDAVDVVVDAGVLVRGVTAQTRVTGSEPAIDRLFLDTLGGDDTVTIGAGVADLIAPEVDLGADG